MADVEGRGDNKSTEEDPGFQLGKQLTVDLTSHRLQIAKSYLATDYDLTFDLALFSLCLDVLKPFCYARKPLQLTLGVTAETSSRDDIEDTPASKRRAATYQNLDLSWLDKNGIEAFESRISHHVLTLFLFYVYNQRDNMIFG